MNREGETVGICLLGSGFGGRNCSERGGLSREGGVSVCFCWLCFLPDVITLWQQNDPPGVKSPSNNRITLRVRWGGLDFGGFARIGRVELSVEGGMVRGLIKTAGGVWQNDPPGAKLPSGFGGDGWVMPDGWLGGKRRTKPGSGLGG